MPRFPRALALASLAGLVVVPASASPPPAPAAPLVEALAWSGMTVDDLQSEHRDSVNADLTRPRDPWRIASADAALSSPLGLQSWATARADILRRDLPSAGGVPVWGGFFRVARKDLKAGGEDPCDRAAAQWTGLVDRTLAFEKTQDIRHSRREEKARHEAVDEALDTRIGSLLGEADLAACRVNTAFAALDEPTRAQVVAGVSALLDGPPLGTESTNAILQGLLSAWSETDRAALLTAGHEWSDALAEAAVGLTTLPETAWPTTPAIYSTEHGEVWIGSPGTNSGSGDPFLIVDPGGDDHWRVLPSATELPPTGLRAVRGWIDLGGDDTWQTGVGGVGAALLSVSAGVDLAGDDVHRTESFATGAAAFGVATWLDLAGEDAYSGDVAVQGFAAFGAAALRDRGDEADTYRADDLAQGAGLPLGIALLHDEGGDDAYDVTSDDDGAAQLDPQQVHGGQGVSMGFFPIVGGGLGWLQDDSGDDTRTGGAAVQGACSAHGIGVAFDRSGDDRWTARAHRAQGAGSEECVGLLVDLQGSDRYSAGRSAQGSAERRAVGVLLDAAGDDRYQADGWSQGQAGVGSVGLLLDRGGDDTYDAVEPGQRRSPPPQGRNIGVLSDDQGDERFVLRPPSDPGYDSRLDVRFDPPADGEAAVALLVQYASVSVSSQDAAATIEALRSTGTTHIAVLLAQLSDDRPAETRVMRQVVLEVAAHSKEEGRRTLAQALTDDALGREKSEADPTVRWHLEQLSSLAGERTEAIEAAIRAADGLRDHPAGQVRAQCLGVYEAIAGARLVEIDPADLSAWESTAAIALQNDAHPEVQSMAARLLKQVGGPGVAGMLGDALAEGDPVIRWEAAQALASIARRTDGLGVARALFPLVEEGSPPVRLRALEILPETGHREIWDVIEPLLADADPRVRAAAVVAALGVGGREVDAALDARLELETEPRVLELLPTTD